MAYFNRHPTIFDHELNHMSQSAIQGPIYVIGYGIASSYSGSQTGTYWKENWYEQDADLCLGQYAC